MKKEEAAVKESDLNKAQKAPKRGGLRSLLNFYVVGFREMTVGKVLWLIILIKVFILFAVLKLFFFKSDLREYKTPEDKSNRVIENLVNT